MKLRHGVRTTLPRFGGAPDTDTCRKRTRRGVGRCFLGRTRPSLWTRKRYVAVLQKVERGRPLQSCPLQSCSCRIARCRVARCKVATKFTERRREDRR
ncbi:hypothetical protein DEO72_LG5g2431 [Vigna unguiculata]|uniref:Uncharacterized protein n=1 Tax=Vigna unguiculata TaxID=3917 RepID=A0A4D6M184_VIGUN|nr:hypothetical protein DEO72_LG5g2431 [Vigna unguiculata]